MAAHGFEARGIERLAATMRRHVDDGSVPGLTWLVARGGQVEAGAAGVLVEGHARPAARDSIYRVSSMSKPVTAVAALALVEDCRIRLEDPVDGWLPELADRVVLADPAGPLDDTVPAARPVTVRDLLTSTCGIGIDFATDGPQPVLAAMASLGLAPGPPRPAAMPSTDEYLRRIGTLPLAHQPGARWLYNDSYDLLGALVARASGGTLAAHLAARVCGPLGMADTAFSVPAAGLHRFGACYRTDEAEHRVLYDPPVGQWAAPPPFPSGAGGLVSTVDDFHAFGQALLDDGQLRGSRILSRSSVEAMRTNQLTDAQLAEAAPGPDGALGWGFGCSVQLRRTGVAPSVGTYGWAGGLGSSWCNDPVEGLVGVLLTNQAWPDPSPPPVILDFWTCAYTALAD